MEKDGVMVTIGKDLTAHVNTVNHQFLADVQVSFGEEKKTPNPYDFLLTALASCTAITLRLYADNKKWPLEKAEITIRYMRDYKEDCMNCDKSDAYLDVMDTRIKLYGNLDEKQVERLKAVATKCPVNKTLSNPIHIQTEVTLTV